MSGSLAKVVFQDLRRDYLQGKPPTQIKLLTNECFQQKSITLTTLLQLTVGETKNPPPIQYRIAFTKYVIKQLESLKASLETTSASASDDDDEDEDISIWYDALESLSREGSQSEPFYRMYDIFGDEENLITVFENETAFVMEGTTGLVTWEASTELAKWMVLSKTSIENEINFIFEMGCGCGFLAIAAMKTFPNLQSYVASDGHHSALSKCRENFIANYDDVPVKLNLEIIDWTTDAKKFQAMVENLCLRHGTGFLFGADIVFDPMLIPSLTEIMILFLKILAENGKKGKVILSCTIRNEMTVNLLKEELGKRKNVNVQTIHTWENGIIIQIDLLHS